MTIYHNFPKTAEEFRKCCVLLASLKAKNEEGRAVHIEVNRLKGVIGVCRKTFITESAKILEGAIFPEEFDIYRFREVKAKTKLNELFLNCMMTIASITGHPLSEENMFLECMPLEK